MDIIKLNIEKNKKLILSKHNNQELNHNFGLIQIYKHINKNTEILDLISIPYHMISCIKNNAYEFYTEYYNYIRSIDFNENIISILKLVCENINYIVKNMINKLLFYDTKHDIPLNCIYDILKIEKSDMFDKLYKEAEVILYQLTLYDKKDVKFYISKVDLLRTILPEEMFYKSLNYIIERYVDIKDINTLQLFNIDISKLNILPQIEDKILNSLLTDIDSLLARNIQYIKKYLSTIKDIKKLLSFDSSNSILKYDIVVIINNNLTEILNEIFKFRINRIKYKTIIINKFNLHLNNILKILQIFAEDNYYLIIYDSIQEEIKAFKLILFETFNNILITLYTYLNLSNLVIYMKNCDNLFENEI